MFKAGTTAELKVLLMMAHDAVSKLHSVWKLSNDERRNTYAALTIEIEDELKTREKMLCLLKKK